MPFSSKGTGFLLWLGDSFNHREHLRVDLLRDGELLVGLGELPLEAFCHLRRGERAPEHKTCLLLRHGDSYMVGDQPSIYAMICPFAIILFCKNTDSSRREPT